jgi:putative transcriptional regulator
MTVTTQYHYTESGLDNVWLMGSGVEIVDLPSGRHLKINDIEGLHHAIGMTLVKEKKNLTGKEIRFLRQELLLSQVVLAKLLDVTEQTVHRWETGKAEIPKPAESLIRFLYQGQFMKTEIKTALEKLADLEDEIDGHDFIAKTCNSEWHLKFGQAA